VRGRVWGVLGHGVNAAWSNRRRAASGDEVVRVQV
jgi:hypothetical protein